MIYHHSHERTLKDISDKVCLYCGPDGANGDDRHIFSLHYSTFNLCVSVLLCAQHVIDCLKKRSYP